MRKARMHFRKEIPYDGRELKVGQLVRAKINARLRAKNEVAWSEPARILERVGKKTYILRMEKKHGKDPQRHIDDLREFEIGDKLLRHCRLTPEAKDAAKKEGPVWGKFDIEYENLETKFEDKWDNKNVCVNYVGRHNIRKLLKKLKERKFKTVYAVLPELRCEDWMDEIEKLPSSVWYGVDPEDKAKVWQDEAGRKIFGQQITWWLIRFDSDGR
mmetsp:Transcript_5998/g.8978  ORF Transcript_5998/g.8978 Transcript_5998/m.8978 type:complete len:215 (+) Transcript_5998:1962-2606(+)